MFTDCAKSLTETCGDSYLLAAKIAFFTSVNLNRKSTPTWSFIQVAVLKLAVSD